MKKITYSHVTPEWIREKLQEHNLTQQQLGELLGLDPSVARQHVNKWVTRQQGLTNITKAALENLFHRLNKTE